jgi:hypothetical protein
VKIGILFEAKKYYQNSFDVFISLKVTKQKIKDNFLKTSC